MARVTVSSYLKNLRAEFAVAYAGAIFSFWPDCCDFRHSFRSALLATFNRL